MFRYVALLWDKNSAAHSAEADELRRRFVAPSADLSREARWRTAMAGEGIGVLVAGDSRAMGAHVLSDENLHAGVVLGEIFERSREPDGDELMREASFGAAEIRAILVSEARCLVNRYWGNFVAIIVDECRGVRFVYNDPCGTLPAYCVRQGGVQVVFSCLGDCRDAGLQFCVNWDFVRARAVNGFLDIDVPCLEGVSSIHRGECVTFGANGASVSRACYWHPSCFDGADEPIVDPSVAARALRAVVRGCVHAMASHHTSVLAQVSGGLDSSIVLGCLVAAPTLPDIKCYTGLVADPVSDERRWARCATSGRGLRHEEVCRDPRALMFADFPALAPSVEPASLFSHWQRGPMDRALASDCSATATFTGEGGDSSLCATAFVYAVDHSLKRHGLGFRTWRMAARVATRRDHTLWTVLGKSVARQFFGLRTRDYRRRLAHMCQLASIEARAVLEEDERVAESWFSSQGKMAPETLLQLGMLAFPPVFYDLSVAASVPSPAALSPLSAQPVFETCARIPVDIHFDAGRSRGLARRAFVNEVPAPILRRQWKDRPLQYVSAVIQKNLPFIRESLLDGVLVKDGILDRAALELALSGQPSRSAALGGEVMNHLDLELWIRNTQRSPARAPA
jgi:asparagine synthase (glutamine-hydrolysing)